MRLWKREKNWKFEVHISLIHIANVECDWFQFAITEASLYKKRFTNSKLYRQWGVKDLWASPMWLSLSFRCSMLELPLEWFKCYSQMKWRELYTNFLFLITHAMYIEHDNKKRFWSYVHWIHFADFNNYFELILKFPTKWKILCSINITKRRHLTSKVCELHYKKQCCCSCIKKN